MSALRRLSVQLETAKHRAHDAEDGQKAAGRSASEGTARRGARNEEPAGRPLSETAFGQRFSRKLRRRWVRRAGVGGAIACMLAAVIVAFGGIGSALREGGALFTAQRSVVTDQFGLTLKRVRAEGRDTVPVNTLVAASGLSIGMPMLDIDPHVVQRAVEALPRVRSAEVHLNLPDEVLLRLEERTPYAVWTIGRTTHVVDIDGVRLGIADDAARKALPAVAGHGANEGAHEILQIIQAETDLEPLVKVAVRVRDRRWTLKLWNGVDILLPEADPAAQLARFMRWEQRDQVLNGAVASIDLRLGSKWFARLRDEAAGPRKPGQET